MPAGSEDPALPVTFRPLGVRMAVIVFGALLLGVCVVTWLAFPPDVRAKFDLFQRVTLVLFGLAIAAGGYALARCRVEARSDGLVVVNGYRSHHYAWAQVLEVSLRPGAPWAVLDLADGSTAAAVGIQGSDGARAARQVRQLRCLVEEHSRPGRQDL